MVVAFTDPSKANRQVLRAQVKTSDGGITFVGGSRGGVNREYKSGVKTYKYTVAHSDLILGIDKSTLDIYVVPTRFIEKWGGSRATSKMQPLKDNWDILINWNKEYLTLSKDSYPKFS